METAEMPADFGPNVELSGFKDIDEAAMGDLRRLVGTYLRRYGEICRKFQKLTLRMKKVHAQVHSEKYEIHASVTDNGRLYTSTTTDKNLIGAADLALSKIESEIGEK